MPDRRDEEIVDLLIRLGEAKGRKEAWRRLAGVTDKDALLSKLREKYRLVNVRHQRDERKKWHDVQAEEGRKNLEAERDAFRRLEQHRNSQLPPLERIANAVQRMRLAQMGPTSAQRFDKSGGAHGDPTEGLRQAPPGSFQGFELAAEEWDRRLERIARMAEHDLALVQGDATVFGGKVGAERDRRILSHLGEEVTWIAYVEGVSTKHVYDLCRVYRNEKGEPYRVRGGRLVLEEPEPGQEAA